METINIDILQPKAKKLIQDLEALDLISIRGASSRDFADLLARMRSQSGAAPSPKEIAREVDSVRSKRQSS